MKTSNPFAILMLAVLVTVSWNTIAVAQGNKVKPKVTVKRTPRDRIFGTPLSPKPTSPTSKHDCTFEEACILMAPYRQWMIGANSTGSLYTKPSWNGPATSSYNLKGLINKKFLQYEKQGAAGGINIGWTSNASASTAKKRAKWFFSRMSSSKKPIQYGEALSFAWGGSKSSFLKYSKRTVGINLDWSSKPSYEWTILGGKPGTPVRKGKDLVIIYNIKHQQPLIWFDRTVGGHIGWPDSKTWKEQAWKKVKKHVTLKNAAKALMIIGAGAGI